MYAYFLEKYNFYFKSEVWTIIGRIFQTEYDTIDLQNNVYVSQCVYLFGMNIRLSNVECKIGKYMFQNSGLYIFIFYFFSSICTICLSQKCIYIVCYQNIETSESFVFDIVVYSGSHAFSI